MSELACSLFIFFLDASFTSCDNLYKLLQKINYPFLNIEIFI